MTLWSKASSLGLGVVPAAAVIAAFLTVSPAIGKAQADELQVFWSMKNLHTVCSSGLVEVFENECLAYVLGVADSFEVVSSYATEGRAFCLPPDANGSGLVARVRARLETVPPTRLTETFSAAEFILEVLVAEYPCG